MRILQLITRSEAGGAQTVARHLAEGLAARGHELVLAYGPEGSGEAFEGMDERVRRVEIGGLVRELRPAAELRALAALRRLYRELGPQVAHLHTSKAAALGRLALPGFGRGPRVVYTMHGFGQLAVSNRKFLSVDRWLSRRGGLTVAVSGADAAAMAAAGYPAGPTVPNGVPEPPERAEGPVADRLRALKERGLPLALCVAREAAPKRPDLFEAAAALLKGKATLAWVGDAGSRGGGSACWLGPARGAAALWRLADLAVLPSDHEGLPMALLEAMAAGLPAVASAVGGIPEALEGGCGAALPNEPEAFAAAIARYIDEPEERLKAGHLARERWRERYSVGAMVDAYERLYRSMEP